MAARLQPRALHAAACTTAVLGAALAGALAPRSLAQDPPETLPRRLREATDKAAAALAARSKNLPASHVGATPGDPFGATDARLRPLVALTLLRAGGPPERELARKLVDSWWDDAVAHRLEGVASANYELALEISALEGLALKRVAETGALTTRSRYEAVPVPGDIARRLTVATRALIEGRVPTAGDKGCAWTYHMAPFRESDATVERAADAVMRNFDNSNTQFSVLALHDAARGGVNVPKAIAEAVASHFLACGGEVELDGLPRQRARGRGDGPAGGRAMRWGYIFCGRSPSASMSCAGLSSLAIARELGAKSDKVDAAIQKGLVGLEELVSEAQAPYDIYSLEKALDILEIEQVGGKDWFAPIAERLLAARRKDGLWEGGTSDDCLRVLFLVRATVSKGRLVDRRTTGGATEGSAGEVFLASKKKTADACALLAAYADAPNGQTATPHDLADEAVRALLAEGHGREACLLGPLATLLGKGGSKREAAAHWVHELEGRELSAAEAGAAASRFDDLLHAREAREAAPLRAALREPSLPLSLQLFAATGLAAIPAPEGQTEVLAALERLAGQAHLLGTPAGARAARTLADALTGLARVPLPALEPKGALEPAALLAVVEAARTGKRQAIEAVVDRALAAYAARDKDAEAWKKARAALALEGKPALARLVAIAAEPARAPAAFAVLRAVTGELIPDDLAAWRGWLEGR